MIFSILQLFNPSILYNFSAKIHCFFEKNDRKTDIIPIYAERMTERLYTVETCQWCVSFVFYRKTKEFIDRKTEDI